MKEGAFLFIRDPQIEGSCNYQGQEGAIEVLSFHHHVVRPVDPHDKSRPAGERIHGTVTIQKMLDKSSPLLIQACSQGRTLGNIRIMWYRQPVEGSTDPELYFVHDFNNCMISAIRPSMAGGTGGGAGHDWMEVVDFGYRQASWTLPSYGVEFNDSVRR